ncbi:MAG: hypothetical protein M3188_05640 [Actinomycetota bacterium]|nr:hypothetical protein [Actinomycetota bacterium]
MRSLPEDMQAYSSAPDDIRRALQAALRGDRAPAADGSPVARGGGTGDQSGNAGSGAGGGDEGSSGGSGGSGGSSSSDGGGTPSDGSGTGAEEPSGGAFRSALEDIGPNDPSSFPIPLLILGGLAALTLLLGAAGLIGRRVQARRARSRR